MSSRNSNSNLACSLASARSGSTVSTTSVSFGDQSVLVSTCELSSMVIFK